MRGHNNHNWFVTRSAPYEQQGQEARGRNKHHCVFQTVKKLWSRTILHGVGIPMFLTSYRGNGVGTSDPQRAAHMGGGSQRAAHMGGGSQRAAHIGGGSCCPHGRRVTACRPHGVTEYHPHEPEGHSFLPPTQKEIAGEKANFQKGCDNFLNSINLSQIVATYRYTCPCWYTPVPDRSHPSLLRGNFVDAHSIFVSDFLPPDGAQAAESSRICCGDI